MKYGILGACTINVLKWAHYSGVLVCLLVGGLYFGYDIGLRGIWTTRIVLFVTLLIGMFLILIADKKSLSKPERIYFKAFPIMHIVAVALSLLTWIGWIILMSIVNILLNPSEKIFYNDSKLRIEQCPTGIMGSPRMDIYEKRWIYEKRLMRSNFPAFDVDSVKVQYDKDSTRVLVYGLHTYDEQLKEKIDTLCLKRVE